MSPPFRVRLARPEDHPVLERLWREIDALHARLQPGFFRPPRGLSCSEAFIRRATAGPDETLLVAEAEAAPLLLAGAVETDLAAHAAPGRSGLLCGVIHLRVYSTPPSANLVLARRGHVEDLGVAAWARGLGCGRGLMEHGVRWARERDASQMVLTVWSGNHGAEAFYRRLGYQPVSTVLAVKL